MTAPDSKIDRSANFISLLAASERQLAAFVFSLVPNASDADEILQETKLRLWEQFDTYDPSRSFSSWARSIAYYQILTLRKSAANRRVQFSSGLIETLADEFPDQEGSCVERVAALRSCLQILSDRCRKLVSGYYGGTRSLDAVARSLGMSDAAARKALYRSRFAIHNCVQRHLAAEERGL